MSTINPCLPDGYFSLVEELPSALFLESYHDRVGPLFQEYITTLPVEELGNTAAFAVPNVTGIQAQCQKTLGSHFPDRYFRPFSDGNTLCMIDERIVQIWKTRLQAEPFFQVDEQGVPTSDAPTLFSLPDYIQLLLSAQWSVTKKNLSSSLHLADQFQNPHLQFLLALELSDYFSAALEGETGPGDPSLEELIAAIPLMDVVLGKEALAVIGCEIANAYVRHGLVCDAKRLPRLVSAMNHWLAGKEVQIDHWTERLGQLRTLCPSIGSIRVFIDQGRTCPSSDDAFKEAAGVSELVIFGDLKQEQEPPWDFLQHMSSLETLSILRPSLQKEDIKNLVCNLDKLPLPKELEVGLPSEDSNETLTELLFAQLDDASKLRKLDLSVASPSQVDVLCKHLPALSEVEELKLQGLKGQDLYQLTQGIRGKENLKSLDLSYCDFNTQNGLDVLLGFAEVIADLPSLQAIKLEGCKLGILGVSVLLSALDGHPTLAAVHLGNNELGSGAIPALCRFVSSTDKLKHFDIDQLDDSDPWCFDQKLELIEALRTQTNLKSLNLGTLGSQEVLLICDSLACWPKLTDISIAPLGVSPKKLQQFVEKLFALGRINDLTINNLYGDEEEFFEQYIDWLEKAYPGFFIDRMVPGAMWENEEGTSPSWSWDDNE